MKKIKKQNELLKMNFFLFNKKLIRNKIVRSQSKLHKLRIFKFCKISLSYFDDKRYI